MKAYLLTAGYATRLHPLTLDRPKSLLEIGGRPMLSHILERVCELDGLSEVIVIGNHRFAEELAAWCEATPCPVVLRQLDDGSMSDDDKLGAIGDLDFALREEPPHEEEAFIVVAGDNWLGFDLRPAQQVFEESGQRATLLLRELDEVPQGPSPYNEVTLDRAGRVLRFREKPDDPATPFVAIAVYFFPPHTRALIEHYLQDGGNPDAPGYFIQWLAQHAPVRGHRFEGEWMDIGSHETLAEARARFG
ncbi:MAG: nucleotidyltransferase family protein [Myxococcota bacterium]|nr:nucleotidyltransferase family protein [Myxococcota bacterium]